MKIHQQKTDDDITPVTMSCIDVENPKESEPTRVDGLIETTDDEFGVILENTPVSTLLPGRNNPNRVRLCYTDCIQFSGKIKGSVANQESGKTTVAQGSTSVENQVVLKAGTNFQQFHAAVVVGAAPEI